MWRQLGITLREEVRIHLAMAALGLNEISLRVGVGVTPSLGSGGGDGSGNSVAVNEKVMCTSHPPSFTFSVSVCQPPSQVPCDWPGKKDFDHKTNKQKG